MNRIEKLIKEKCPNGIEYKKILEIWERAPKSKLGVKQVSMMSSGNVICFTSGEKTYNVNEYLVDGEYLFLNDGGSADVKYNDGLAYYTDHVLSFTVLKQIKLKTKFLYYYLRNMEGVINDSYFRGTGIKNLVMSDFVKIKIPIPPIEIQEEIVKILDKFSELEAELEAELELRVKQYEFWREKLLINNNYELKRLSDVFTLKRGKRLIKKDLDEQIGFPVYQNSLTPLGFYSEYNVLENNTFLVAAGAANSIGFSKEKFWIADDCFVFEPIDKYEQKLLFYSLLTQKKELESLVRRASIPRLSRMSIENIKIPIPSLDQQKHIVNILDKFDNLTNNIKEGLPAEIALRKQQYEYYRNKLLTFDELITN